MKIVPVTFKYAKEFVSNYHRHNPNVVGCKFAIGCIDGNVMIGVAICGRPVNFDLKFPDPWSATLDHIIPISKGGSVVDIENLQLAHLQCNRMKASRLPTSAPKKQTLTNRDLPLSLSWETYHDIHS